MNEDRYLYRTFASSPSSTVTPPPLITTCLSGEKTPMAKIDAALAQLRLHLSYGRYAGYIDTIRADVDALDLAWEQYKRGEG